MIDFFIYRMHNLIIRDFFLECGNQWSWCITNLFWFADEEDVLWKYCLSFRGRFCAVEAVGFENEGIIYDIYPIRSIMFVEYE